MAFQAFSDSVSSEMLDNLTLENQGDRLSIYGSLQLGCDQQSLQHALHLKTILEQAIAYLQQHDLSVTPKTPDDSEQVDNPFLSDH